MNTRSKPADDAQIASKAKRSHVDCLEDACSVVERLTNHLMTKARERTIRRAVSGGRFCSVILDDGGVGLANLCPEVCGEPSRSVSDRLPRPATPAVDALATLAPPVRSAIGLATANALANRFPRCGSLSDEASIRGDLLEVLELKPDDHVGMVGCFYPLVEGIRRRVRCLSIFERGQRLSPDLLPEGQAAELLPRCSVALITATAMTNGTID